MRYPKREIAKLYGLRWEIETHFRHLKSTMGMEHLKCQSVDGVLKELMMYVLVYNLVRAAMMLAAQRQNVADANRMSFVDALRRLRSVLAVNKAEADMALIVNRAPGPKLSAGEEEADEGIRPDEQAACGLCASEGGR